MPENKISISNLLDTRSEEVQEIISRPPHWLIRWGISVFFFILLLVLFLSWLIKYPDVVNASVRLVSINSPKAINAKITGKLIRLVAKEQTAVHKDDVLAWLESIASHEEVIDLSKALDGLQKTLDGNDFVTLVKFNDRNYTHLGEIQPAFQSFDNAYIQLKAYLTNGFYIQKQAMLVKEEQFLSNQQQNLIDQKGLMEQDFELAKSEFESNKQLSAQKVIAPIDYKREESKFLAKKSSLKQMDASIINMQSSLMAKQREKMELDKQISDQKLSFAQSLNTLRSEIENWKSKYLLIAPIDGTLLFSTFLQENQTIKTGQEVFYIAPSTTNYYGEMNISQYSFGKIRKGQRVNLKFSAYPYQEFGMVNGTISYISEVPTNDSIFMSKVEFKNGLKTNFGKVIKPRLGMTAQAEIITADKRLIERFFNNIRTVFYKN